jgi:hypothetical protein
MALATTMLGAAALLAISAASFAVANDDPGRIVYPPGSGVFNVVTDGGIDNTGVTDVTQPLQQLLDESHRRLQVLYFPEGTYLVSGSLRMKLDTSRSDRSHSHGPWIVGESRERTVIRLKDHTWPEAIYRLYPIDGPPEKKIYDQAVLSTGDATNTTFNKIIRNLTVHVGRGNAGAVGVMYNTSNTGYLGEVSIVSEDGAGLAGLALAGVENGPGQVRNVNIHGFDVGVYNVTDYVIACSDVVIEGARKVGLLNHGQTAAEDWAITMAGTDAPAIHNTRRGVFSAIGLKLTGRSRHAAILDEGQVYLRDVQTDGYAQALKSHSVKQPSSHGTAMHETYSGKAVGLFHDPGAALSLPIKKQPYVPYEVAMGKWTSPLEFGAVGDGKTDDTDAIQAALTAEGKSHVVLPSDKVFRVTRPLTLGGDIQRVVGTQGRISTAPQDKLTFTIGNGTAPIVVVEGISQMPPIYVRTDRTVVLDSVRVQYELPQPWPRPMPAEYRPVGFRLEGAGDVFINNTGSSFIVNNPRQHVWVRHYNSELGTEQGTQTERSPVVVQAGTLWMLGWKSENLARRVMVHRDGAMELTGFNNYEVSARMRKDGHWPAFEIIDGQLSINMFVQRGSQRNYNMVWETRDGEMRKLTADNNPNDSTDVSLYTGYVPARTAR